MTVAMDRNIRLPHRRAKVGAGDHLVLGIDGN